MAVHVQELNEPGHQAFAGLLNNLQAETAPMSSQKINTIGFDGFEPASATNSMKAEENFAHLLKILSNGSELQEIYRSELP